MVGAAGGPAWTHTGYAQQIVFGAGSVGRVADLVRATGARRVLLVTTAGRLASDDGRRLVSTLGTLLVSTFAEVESHVPVPLVQDAVRQARRDGVDAVVSFGGGSCADLAKAVNWFTEQGQGIPSTSWADRPALPHVAVPTTYSGAELTPFFGMTDPAARRKQGAGGPTCAPLAAVYDPDLTATTPARVRAETGMNALAHCVEIVWSPTATPEAVAVGLAGAGRIAGSLAATVADPDDGAARHAMFEGAVLGGRCLQNGAMGIHHGLAQLVGGRTRIPHGLANAVILPHAIRFNAPAVPAAVERLAVAMGVSGGGDALADHVAALVAELGLPTTLAACGVDEADLDAVAESSGASPAVQANPRPVSEADARRVLAEAYGP